MSINTTEINIKEQDIQILILQSYQKMRRLSMKLRIVKMLLMRLRRDLKNKIIRRILTNYEIKTPHNTRYKTLGFRWLFECSAPHQSSVSGDSDVARNPQRFHTADRYQKATIY